jgi:hypothetical protein
MREIGLWGSEYDEEESMNRKENDRERKDEKEGKI